MTQELVDLLAMQKIKADKDAATRAMQMAQPMQGPSTVAQKLQSEAMDSARQEVAQKMGLKAALAGRQQQAQQALMQRISGAPGPVPAGTPQPTEQPQAEGIDRIPTQLGQYYSGGIVAFADGGGVETDEEREARMQALLAQIPTDGYSAPEGGERVSGSELGRQVRGTLSALPGASGLRQMVPAHAAALAGLEGLRSLLPAAPGLEAEVGKLGQREPRATPTATNTAQLPDEERPRWAAPTGPAAPPPAKRPPAPPAPGARQRGLPAAIAAQQPPGDDLSAEMDKYIRAGIAPVDRDRDALMRRTQEEQRSASGIDEILKSREARAAKLEALQQRQADPWREWRKFVYSLDPNARGGFGASVAAGGRGLWDAQGRWAAEDVKNLETLNKLRDDIDTARLSGNKAAYDAAVKRYEDAVSTQRAVGTTGAQVLETREAARTRVEASRLAAQARADAARARQEDKATAAVDKTDAAHRDTAMRLAATAARKIKEGMAGYTTYKDTPEEEIAASLFNKYYQGLKSGKMGATEPELPDDVRRLVQKILGTK
jgi:hypothetical protein